MSLDNEHNQVGLAVTNPFGKHEVAETSGARQSQSREVSEMQVKYLMAQQFPRDERACMDSILNAFTRPTLAEKAQYQFARGGTDIVGPSIRSAETIALNWSNMEFGFREISRGIGADGIPFSEVEAFARDLQKRTQRPAGFIVRHWRDTKAGGYKLKDERDIYELVSNQAQRRVRACILALIPGDVIEAAMNQAELTLKTTADTSPEATQKMVKAFERFGVTKEMIEKRIQRRLDAIQPAQVVALRRVYASLDDDMSVPSDWFEGIAKPVEKGGSVTVDDLKKRGITDPETGEISQGSAEAAEAAQETRTANAGATTASKPPKAPKGGPSYAQIRDRIKAATMVDDAAIALDAARELPDDQKKELGAYFDERLQAGELK